MPNNYALEISQLSKTYVNQIQALDQVSLNISQGDFFALLGPNGAGKSTLIGILSSLVIKTAGQVRVMGIDFTQHPSLAKANLGIVPQEVNLNIFETCEQTMLNQAAYQGMPRALAKPRIQCVLDEVGLLDKRHSVTGRLSGGMKRRLMIARALLHDPNILVLDEPTAGVDVEIRQSMWLLLRKLNQQGKTIILTTHYLEEAENLCNSIAIIDKGRIVEHTSMKTLLSRLDHEVIVLYLSLPRQTAPILPSFDCNLVESDILEVTLKSTQSITELFSQLAQQGIVVTRMRNKTNRLESLFMNLVRRDKHE
jgi:ABC-2 type transport system ATP-binding protein